jgi:predicted DCC family thiol-disulfide oxidoreductase YuxK
MEADRVLIYDARCRLCVTAKEAIERSGSQDVRFVPYQTEEAACRLGSAYATGRPDVAFLVEPDGTIHRGLDAFAALLPGIRGGKLLLPLLRIPLIRPLGYVAYRLIARYRYRLFGEVPCK